MPLTNIYLIFFLLRFSVFFFTKWWSYFVEGLIIIIIMLFRFKAAHGIRHESSQAEEKGTDCTDYSSLTRSFHFWKGFPLLIFRPNRGIEPLSLLPLSYSVCMTSSRPLIGQMSDCHNFSEIHQSLITGLWDFYGLNLWVRWVEPDPIVLNRIPWTGSGFVWFHLFPLASMNSHLFLEGSKAIQNVPHFLMKFNLLQEFLLGLMWFK